MAVVARTSSASRTMPFGLLGDERLARLAAAGHERAFAVVYQRHHQALYRYCRSILRNDSDAQDALQSTFTAAFAALGRAQPDAPIRPWLFRIAHNEAVSALRRRRPAADLSEAVDCCTTSVEDQAEERANLDLLLRDLRELNERQRSAVVMRELSGLSHEEIAEALETSVGAAKQTIYEARQSLFEFAEGRAMGCDDIRRTISDADGRLLRSRRVRAHLRDCSACAAFSASIPGRSRELRALAPPLPVLTAASLLGRVVTAGSSHSGGGGVAGLAAGAAGKATGAALAANALAGVAVVATATVGVTVGVDKLVHPGGRVPAPAVAPGAGPMPSSRPGAATPSSVSSSSVAGPSTPGVARLVGHRAGGRGSARAGATSTSTPVRAGRGHPAGASGSAASGRSSTAASGTPPSAGADKPATAGPGKPPSTGAGKPATAGAGKPATAGAGKPATAGAGKPATAGSGKPPWAASGNGSGGSGSAGSGNGPPPGAGQSAPSSASPPAVVPPVTPPHPPHPPHPSAGGPPADTPGATPHGH